MMSCVEIILIVNDSDEAGRGEAVWWATVQLDVLDETEVSCDVSVMYFLFQPAPTTTYYMDLADQSKLHSS